MGGLSLRQVQARGSTEAKFEDRKAVPAVPKRAGVIDLADKEIVAWAGIVDPAWVFIQPFGVGPAGCRMSFRLRSWNSVDERERLYVPTPPLFEAVAVLDGEGTQIQDGVRLAGHIASNKPNSPIVVVLEGAMVVNVLAARWIEFEFAKPEGSEVESMNAFWKPVRQ